jgi:hypothetical protein
VYITLLINILNNKVTDRAGESLAQFEGTDGQIMGTWINREQRV